MNYSALLRPCALGLVLAAAMPLAWGQSATHRMVDPDKLTWGAVPSLPPGAQLAAIEGPMNEAVPFTVRLKFPAGYRIPPHWHPAVERVTVISGTFHMGTGERFDTSGGHALVPGAVAILPARHPHFAWTERETVVQLHGTGPWGVTYVNPADDPRGRPAAAAAPPANPTASAGGPPAAPRGNPWSMAYNPLAGFQSTATRAEVKARYLGAREEVEALTGEDSGSAYLRASRR